MDYLVILNLDKIHSSFNSSTTTHTYCGLIRFDPKTASETFPNRYLISGDWFFNGIYLNGAVSYGAPSDYNSWSIDNLTDEQFLLNILVPANHHTRIACNLNIMTVEILNIYRKDFLR